MVGVSEESLLKIYGDIRDAVMDRLTDSNVLSDIKEVIYGERQRIGQVASPALWVVPESWQPALQGGVTVQHDIPFTVVSLVKNSRPQDGLREAEDWILKAYDVLVDDRSLNGLVSDVRPMQIDPAHEAGQNTQLSYAAVRFEFRLKRRE